MLKNPTIREQVFDTQGGDYGRSEVRSQKSEVGNRKSSTAGRPERAN